MKKIFLMLALLCTVLQGAWAQANWDAVYKMTQTTSANWTALNSGSTTGQTLGTAGTTTYYYAAGNLSFTNSNAGGSGLTIQGTVYLYVPEGVTVTCTGANGSGQTGGGAGIELTAGNTLYLIGQGTVSATGGRAANGGNGGNGDSAGSPDTMVISMSAALAMAALAALPASSVRAAPAVAAVAAVPKAPVTTSTLVTMF